MQAPDDLDTSLAVRRFKQHAQFVEDVGQFDHGQILVQRRSRLHGRKFFKTLDQRAERPEIFIALQTREPREVFVNNEDGAG